MPTLFVLAFRFEGSFRRLLTTVVNADEPRSAEELHELARQLDPETPLTVLNCSVIEHFIVEERYSYVVSAEFTVEEGHLFWCEQELLLTFPIVDMPSLIEAERVLLEFVNEQRFLNGETEFAGSLSITFLKGMPVASDHLLQSGKRPKEITPTQS